MVNFSTPAKEKITGCLRRAILADLREWTADLVKLAADLVKQMEPPRGQDNGPFGALAIQLEQSYAMLAVVGHAVYNLVKRELGDGLAEPP